MFIIIHYSYITIGAMASQIISLAIAYSTVFFWHRSQKTSKPRVTGLGEGNSVNSGEFPTQRASNAEKVFIWWCLQEIRKSKMEGIKVDGRWDCVGYHRNYKAWTLSCITMLINPYPASASIMVLMHIISISHMWWDYRVTQKPWL